MRKNILVPFYAQLTEDKVIKFGICFDEYVAWVGSPNYAESAEELVHTEPTLISALYGTIGACLLRSNKTIKEYLKTFLKIHLDDMPLYIIKPQYPITKDFFCPLPLPGRGPKPWQIIMARWRLIISY
jgi:methylaspartate ammonia-lyase